MGFELGSDRISRIRIKWKFLNTTIISVCAPTEEADEVEKFYSELSITCDSLPKYDAIILMGGLNVKIGKENCNNDVAGKYTLHDTRSENKEINTICTNA
jgi:hypothetical protein